MLLETSCRFVSKLSFIIVRKHCVGCHFTSDTIGQSYHNKSHQYRQHINNPKPSTLAPLKRDTICYVNKAQFPSRIYSPTTLNKLISDKKKLCQFSRRSNFQHYFFSHQHLLNSSSSFEYTMVDLISQHVLSSL